MASIGIVTIIDHSNFGNRLQNYALQETLRLFGHEAVTIRNTPRRGDGARPWTRRLQTLRRSGPRAFADKWRAMRTPPFQPPELVMSRLRGNGNFTSELIAETDIPFEAMSDPAALAEQHDRFLVGSDQVWNPDLRRLNGIDFLTFARLEQRAAYATSIGVPRLDRYTARRYKTFLSGIPEISVREFEAADIVLALTGREVPVVLDPTMLVNIDQWRGLAVEGQRPAQRYLATFHLGDPDSASEAATAEFARTHGWLSVDMNDVETPEYFATTPAQFIATIMNAEFLITDSFHAAVFATLFRTPYAIRGRLQMNSRFSTLAAHTGIQAMGWTSAADLEALRDVDWTSVEARLDERRTHSLAFLAEALNGK